MYPLPDYTKEETAWLAGILEGEGCFLLDYSGGDRRRVVVALKMTDKDIVERVQRLFGGRAMRKIQPPNDHHKSLYLVRVQGKKAQEVMRRIYPHMGQRRREKIDSLL